MHMNSVEDHKETYIHVLKFNVLSRISETVFSFALERIRIQESRNIIIKVVMSLIFRTSS